MAIAAVRRVLEADHIQHGLSLLFAVGDRPSATAIERLLASDIPSGQRAQVTHRPDEVEGWLELIASGLTFDLTGLVPAPGTTLPPPEQQFGLEFDPTQFNGEAMTLRPGPHVAGGAALLPLVRTIVGLAASLALALPVQAVCWRPANCWMEPTYFSRIVVNWLSGGAFPALGLTAVGANADGSVESWGLAYFVGQELRMEPLAGEARAETVKLVVRAIDHIVRHGPLTALQELQGPAGETMLAEPSHDGRLIRVWRSL